VEKSTRKQPSYRNQGWKPFVPLFEGNVVITLNERKCG